MPIARKDRIFMAVIAALLGTLLVSTGRGKAKNVPNDERHGRCYQAMHAGADRMERERGCAACHGSTSTPLSKGHPPKEQCLLCHKLFQAGRQQPPRQ